MTAITLAMSELAPPQPLASPGTVSASTSIEDLAVRLQADRDGPTFELLIKKTEKAGYHLALSLLKDPELAKDALQESFFVVYRQIDQLREPGAFKSWLFRIINRTCHDIIRKRKREVETDLADREDLTSSETSRTSEPDPSRSVTKKQLLRATFESLPEIDREAIALREICSLSYDEMAQALSVPIGTVRSRLAKARQRFINAYRKEQNRD